MTTTCVCSVNNKNTPISPPVVKMVSVRTMILWLVIMLAGVKCLPALELVDMNVNQQTNTPVCDCPGCCPPRTLPCCDPFCPKCLGVGPAPLPFPDSGCQFGCNGQCPGFCPCDACACCYTVRTTCYTTTSIGCVQVNRATVTNSVVIVEYENSTLTSTSMVTLTVSDIYQFTTIVTATTSISSTSTSTFTFTLTTITLSTVALTTTTTTSNLIATSVYLTRVTTTPTARLSQLGFFSSDLLSRGIDIFTGILVIASSSFGITTQTSTNNDLTSDITRSQTLTRGIQVSVGTGLRSRTATLTLTSTVRTVSVARGSQTNTLTLLRPVTSVTVVPTQTVGISSLSGTRTVTVTNSVSFTTSFTVDIIA
jgi:hypothetical protein